MGEVDLMTGQKPPLGQGMQEVVRVPPPVGLYVPIGQGTGSKHKPKHQYPAGQDRHLEHTSGEDAKHGCEDSQSHEFKAQPNTDDPNTTLFMRLSQPDPQQQQGCEVVLVELRLA